MKVNLCSETELYNIHGEGVSSSFSTCLKLLKESNDIEVVINSDGKGDIMHCHTYGPYFFLRGLKYKGKRIHTSHVIPDSAKGTFPGWRLSSAVCAETLHHAKQPSNQNAGSSVSLRGCDVVEGWPSTA